MRGHGIGMTVMIARDDWYERARLESAYWSYDGVG
jgi:hypothetical protein